MKLKNIFIGAGICFAFLACNKNSKNAEITISGKINHPSESGAVVLEKWEGQIPTPIDTLAVKDSTFNVNSDELESGFYRLNFYNQQNVNLVLDGNENINIQVDGNNPKGVVEIKGSKSHDLLDKANVFLEDFRVKATQIEIDYSQAMASGDALAENLYTAKFDSLQNTIQTEIKNLINSNEIVLGDLQLVGLLDPDKDINTIDKVAQELKKKYPELPIITDFAKQVENSKKLAIGSKAPNFTLPQPDGKKLSLSDFEGQYVLIDFWASWCPPCRKANPHLVSLYDEYHSKGIEFIGVSLDKDKDKWEQAITDDKLTWPQVSDLKYFNSEVAKEYQVNSIPSTFLLDKDGKIIAKNLRGEELDEKLKELFH
ncbi:TlpA disulfide reductase family protein [Aureibacter tunicatorum]|uniref:Peroxiredoxin n=1 Tax=Aureibacter tunicatorum TaxID=866807 RepID=A0AAE3XSP7_9BACT|nr:TlpA disulfide reductase family protein [Aureibacter tunicatorum]MDR6240874.1 peroxiredoxin [Aureibacter tunicatorum]BDD03654.1 thiol:disulfide interchange protein [Aureibacter tunicatorum]